jgi:hypothetical protein
MRIRLPSNCVAHAEPKPTASSHPSAGRRVGLPTTRLDRGSMRETVHGRTAVHGLGGRLSTHTYPSPAATLKGWPGTRMRTSAGRSRATAASSSDFPLMHPVAAATSATAATTTIGRTVTPRSSRVRRRRAARPRPGRSRPGGSCRGKTRRAATSIGCPLIRGTHAVLLAFFAAREPGRQRYSPRSSPNNRRAREPEHQDRADDQRSHLPLLYTPPDRSVPARSRPTGSELLRDRQAELQLLVVGIAAFARRDLFSGNVLRATPTDE